MSPRTSRESQEEIAVMGYSAPGEQRYTTPTRPPARRRGSSTSTTAAARSTTCWRESAPVLALIAGRPMLDGELCHREVARISRCQPTAGGQRSRRDEAICLR